MSSHRAGQVNQTDIESFHACLRGGDDMDPTLDLTNCLLNVPFAVIAACANALLMAAIWKTPSLHTASNILLFSLALSDFAVGCILQPLFITWRVANLLNVRALYCTARASYGHIGRAFVAVSLTTLTAISVDKYMSIHFHLRYPEIVTCRRAKLIVLALWFVACLLSVLSLWNFKIIQLVYASLSFFCIIVGIVSYGRLYLVMLRQLALVDTQLQAVAFNLGQFGTELLNERETEEGRINHEVLDSGQNAKPRAVAQCWVGEKADLVEGEQEKENEEEDEEPTVERKERRQDIETSQETEPEVIIQQRQEQKQDEEQAANVQFSESRKKTTRRTRRVMPKKQEKSITKKGNEQSQRSTVKKGEETREKRKLKMQNKEMRQEAHLQPNKPESTHQTKDQQQQREMQDKEGITIKAKEHRAGSSHNENQMQQQEQHRRIEKHNEIEMLTVQLQGGEIQQQDIKMLQKHEQGEPQDLRQEQRIQQCQEREHDVELANVQDSDPSSLSERKKNLKKKKHEAVSVMCLHLLFAVCFSPYIGTAVAVLKNDWNSSNMTAICFSTTVLMINSSLNPLVLGWRLSKLRKPMLKIVKSCFRRT